MPLAAPAAPTLPCLPSSPCPCAGRLVAPAALPPPGVREAEGPSSALPVPIRAAAAETPDPDAAAGAGARAIPELPSARCAGLPDACPAAGVGCRSTAMGQQVGAVGMMQGVRLIHQQGGSAVPLLPPYCCLPLWGCLLVRVAEVCCCLPSEAGRMELVLCSIATRTSTAHARTSQAVLDTPRDCLCIWATTPYLTQNGHEPSHRCLSAYGCTAAADKHSLKASCSCCDGFRT